MLPLLYHMHHDAVGDENDGVAGQLIVEGPPTPANTVVYYQ
jgi:hypothetical protein